MTYAIMYWYPKQSRLSSPQVFLTEDINEWLNALKVAELHGYEIINKGILQDNIIVN